MKKPYYQVEIRNHLSIRASNSYSIFLVVDGVRKAGLYRYQRKKLSGKLFGEILYYLEHYYPSYIGRWGSYFKDWIKKEEIINYYDVAS